MTRPVKGAARSVDAAAVLVKRLGAKIEKYGVRMTFIKMLPKPVIDFTIKKKK